MNLTNAREIRRIALVAAVLLGCTPTPRPAEVPDKPSDDAVSERASSPPNAPRKQARRTASPAPTDGLHLVRTTGPASGPLTYELIEPADHDASLPLIVALHGRGDRAESFAHLFEQLRLRARVVVVRAPIPWGQRGGRQWFRMGSSELPEEVASRVAELHELVQLLKKRHPGTPAPVVVGFSQGAMLGLQWLARHPEDLAGVMALSGALLLEQGNVPSAAPVPVVLTTGEKDTLVPPARSDEAAQALKALGHQPVVHRFDGGHAIPRDLRQRLGQMLKTP